MKNNYLLITILFLVLISFNTNAQILTFEFNGLAGNEASANSNSNDTNISSSTITRGSGLTASNNGNRFNATSWNTGSVTDAITGNDYMEFTITPNSGFEFSVTSIDVNVQRSGSGPRAISLRSSVDSYASNLDAEKSISDNTSTQTFTFTFSQTSSVAVTYRFYLHSAESTGGSGGFEGTGNDIVVNGSTAADASESVGFDSATSSQTETDATFNVNIPVTLSNYGGSQVDLSVTVDGSSTAEGGDYTLNTSSLSFTSSGTQNISLDINSDADFDAETIILNIAETTATGITISTSQHTVTVSDDEIPTLVINEFLADPATSVADGDSNGDGVRNSSDDEFIEIVNTETVSVDISNYTIEESSSLVHTFAASTVLPAGGSIVIFGGGTPTGIPGLSVTATSGSVSLSNSSGSIELKNAGGTSIDSYSYGSEAGSDQSIARSFDLTGSFVQHNTITSNSANFSPGRYNLSNLSFELNSWKGSTDNDWTNGSNWSSGSAPGVSDDIQILAGLTNYPTASSAITVNSMTINSGATFITSSTFTGNITYNRTLGTVNWYLISSPVSGQDIDAFVSAEGLATGSGNNLGFAPYTNNGSAWDYYQSGASGTGDFVEAKGYSIKLASAGDISFTGTMITDNETIEITDGSANEFNLVGNPYPSYISANDDGDNGLNNILTVNGTDNSFLSESTIWLWDQSANGGTGGYDQLNHASAAFYIAPGQGFFVNANTTGAPHTFQINENMQSHQSSDSFQRNTSTRPEVQLLMTNGSSTRDADIYYIDGTTTGFDNGYDSSIFGGVSNSFAVYTEAVANSQGRKLGIQSLPNSELENMIIPVGVNSDAGNLTFTVKASNLPNGYMVFLEDKETGNFIRLDENGSKYDVTLNSSLSGVGRFFLHTTTNSLSNATFNEDNISAYISQKNNLKVVGIQQGTTTVRMFNILGKQVLNSTFQADGANDVTLPNLRQGVYIIQISSEQGKISKKIVIE